MEPGQVLRTEEELLATMMQLLDREAACHYLADFLTSLYNNKFTVLGN